MAAAGEISHRPDLHAGVSASWSAMGENVGQGSGVADLMVAFIDSPHHFANLVDPRFNRVGVGSVRSTTGALFTTHIFMALRGGSVVAAAEVEAPAPPVTAAAPPRPPTTRAPWPAAPPTPTPATPTTLPPPLPAPAAIPSEIVRSDSQRFARFESGWPHRRALPSDAARARQRCAPLRSTHSPIRVTAVFGA